MIGYSRKIFLVLFVLSIAKISFSQTFTASTDNTTVGLTDNFQVTFSFSGKDINGVKNFNPPSFNNFLVLSGPNQSSSMQIINGAVSGSLSFSYILQPKSMGKLTIGTASVDYNGSSIKSSPLEITVVKGSAKPKNQSSNTISTKEIADNLFIKAIVDRRKVYLGEQVTVTYKLYTRLNIAAQMSISKLPQYQGFWSEEIQTPNNISFTTEVYNGKQYRVGILKKAALFPSQTGELKVTPFELNVPVQIRKKRSGNNFFDDFFNDPFGNSQTYNYDAKSNAVKVDVKALPSKDVPASYNGAVGDFKFSASVDKENVKTNESLTLKLIASGTGNISLLNLPEINLPNGFEKYEPKTNSNINRTGKISGTKTAEYLIVPRTPGKKVIPPIEFTYFDINKKKYITETSKPFTINVTPGENYTSGSGEAGFSKENVKLLGQDIHYIKTSFDDISKSSDLLLFSKGFWFAAGLPLFLLIGLVYWKKREDKLAGNIQLLRYQKAEKVAKNRLKAAKKLMEANNYNEFYSEISQALFGYLEDKFHIPKSDFTLEGAADLLRENNISEEVITGLKECAEKCEFARFAPKAGESAAKNELYSDTSKVIIEIEKILSVKK
jgi:hypothetical protein